MLVHPAISDNNKHAPAHLYYSNKVYSVSYHHQLDNSFCVSFFLCVHACHHIIRILYHQPVGPVPAVFKITSFGKDLEL